MYHTFVIILFPFLFALISFFAFFIPGFLVLGNFKMLSTFERKILSMPIGMVLFGWQGFIFGYLHIRFATYFYLLIFSFIFFAYHHNFKIKNTIGTIKSWDWLSIVLIIVGTIGQTISYFEMGIKTAQGLSLSTRNTPDHLWHVALTNEIVRHFPPFEPGMYGIYLKNYHYWFNLITAEIVRIFHTPLFQTHVLGMYILGSLLYGALGYIFMCSITKNRSAARWLLFFSYFGGDVIYWLTYITSRKFDFNGILYLENGTMFIDNPPRAFSIVIALACMFLLFKITSKTTKTQIILISLCVGTIVGFKVYTGIAFFIGLFFFALHGIYIKQFRYIFIFIFGLLISLIVFLPNNSASGGLFFLPFDLPRDFISQKEIGLTDWALRWEIYFLHHNYIRLFQYGIMMTIVYITAQFGVRLIGIYPYKKSIHLLGFGKFLFLYSGMLLSFILGIFFYQYSGGSNIFNFFLSASFFMTILSSIHLSLLSEKKSVFMQIFIIVVIVIFSLPRWLYMTSVNIGNYFTPLQKISQNELASYEFLRTHTDEHSVVLVLNTGYLDSITPLVSIFSQRNMYLSGQGIIDSHSVDNKERIRVVKKLKFLSNKDAESLLKLSKVNYVYSYNSSSSGANLGQTVFLNKAARIEKIAD